MLDKQPLSGNCKGLGSLFPIRVFFPFLVLFDKLAEEIRKGRR